MVAPHIIDGIIACVQDTPRVVYTMCSLCDYRGKNIKRHLLSSAHRRGLSACVASARRLLRFGWIRREIAHQRDLGHWHPSQEDILEELTYVWTCDARVGSLWSICGRWFSDVRLKQVRREFLGLPEDVVEEIVCYLPECQSNYSRCSPSGNKNFQMSCSNMGRRRSPIDITSSAVRGSRSLTCLTVKRSKRPCADMACGMSTV